MTFTCGPCFDAGMASDSEHDGEPAGYDELGAPVCEDCMIAAHEEDDDA